MEIGLEWHIASEVQNLSKEEMHKIQYLCGEQKLDLDAGRTADNEVAGAAAFHSVFQTERLPDQEFSLLDFGIIRNIRKVKFVLNGIEIGMTGSRQTEAAYVVKTSWLRHENSLLALIVDGSKAPVWIKGKGRTDFLPDDYRGEREELPVKLALCELQPAAAKGTLNIEGNTVQLCDGSQRVTMTFWKGDVFRLRIHRRERPFLIDEICLDQLGDHMEAAEGLHGEFVERESGTVLRMDLEHHSVEIIQNPLQVMVYDGDGTLLFHHLPVPMQTEKYCGIAVALKEREHIFGLGENATPSMDKRGQVEEIWTSHDWIHCDIPVPFYISTEGYGLYLNNSHHSFFDMGKTVSDKALIWALGGELDYFFLPGPDPKRVLANFTKVTGRTKLPPRWAFGFFQSKTGADSSKMVEEKIESFRKHRIPLDVISIDPGWQNDFCDWQWNKEDFPSERDFMQMLKKNHMRLMLWSAPFVKKDCKNYAEGVEKGLFLKNANGSTLPSLWWKDTDSGIVDFTNPEATEWWIAQCRPLIKAGVDIFKIDGGDGGEVPAWAGNYQGVTGREFHNLYPLYFAKAFYEGLQRERPGKRVMVWERTGFAGSGKYPCTWGGDQPADFTGTEVLIKGGQQAGLGGIFYWAPDVGGFAENSGTSEEFFIRSYQWGALAPMSRGHGNRTEPYEYGERALEIVRSYIELRYRLLPYIYSCAYEAMRDSVPMMRAMVLEHPEDPECYQTPYQYFIGSGILAAPVHEPGDPGTLTAAKDIYLPQGRYVDFWTEDEYEGERHITYEAALPILPLFIKKGSIIPMLSAAMHTEDYDGTAYELHIYPAEQECSFLLYFDDGESLEYENGVYDMIEISAVLIGEQVRVKIETQKDSMKFREIQFQVMIHDGKEGRSAALMYRKGERAEVMV